MDRPIDPVQLELRGRADPDGEHDQSNERPESFCLGRNTLTERYVSACEIRERQRDKDDDDVENPCGQPIERKARTEGLTDRRG